MEYNFTIADFASLIVAASAVAIAFWNGYATRKHYRLSVRPRFRLSNRFRKTVDFFGVRLVNGGLGPGVVKDVKLMLDGDPVDYSHQGWMGALREAEIEGDWSLTRLLVGTVILAGEQIWLFRTDELPEGANEIIRKLSRLEMVIQYESLYGETQQPVKSRLATRASIIEDKQSAISDDA